MPKALSLTPGLQTEQWKQIGVVTKFGWWTIIALLQPLSAMQNVVPG